MLTTFIDTLMSAEADAVCGAEYGECSSERTNGALCARAADDGYVVERRRGRLRLYTGPERPDQRPDVRPVIRRTNPGP